MTKSLLFAAAAVCLVAANQPADAVKAEMAKMEGTWTFEKLVQNGNEPVPADELKKMRVEVKGDTRVVKQGDEERVRSTYTIDPKADPKTIDIKVMSGGMEGRTLYGIYELDGDTFKICLALEGKERPKKLESAADSGTVLQVFKRAKADKK